LKPIRNIVKYDVANFCNKLAINDEPKIIVNR